MCLKCNIFIFLVLLSNHVHSQFVSPCPRLFRYEENSMEMGRWYGQIILLFNSDLDGVWVRLKFDRPVIQIGNWFGHVQVNSNIEFELKNPGFVLEANKPQKIRFFVVYDTTEPPPQLTRFLLNARTLCPEKVSQNTTLDFEQFWAMNGPSTAAIIPNNFLRTNIPSSDYDTCGQTSSIIYPLISHGDIVLPGESPWHAALYHYQEVVSRYICGGTLISRNHVITAAHCVTKPHTTVILMADDFGVYLGKTNLRLVDEGTQFSSVSKIFVHPEFEAKQYLNDIAILKLTKPVEITKYVRKCCLWEEDPHIDLIVGKIGTVVGWGLDETNSFSQKLLKTKLPVNKPLDCIYSDPDFFSRFTFEKNFCAGYTQGASVCNGDSGGGLILFQNNSKISYLRGIVSNRVLHNTEYCDKSSYAIFTDVAQYLFWIKDILLK